MFSAFFEISLRFATPERILAPGVDPLNVPGRISRLRPGSLFFLRGEYTVLDIFRYLRMYSFIPFYKEYYEIQFGHASS